MKTIEDHIEFDKQRIEDPTVSSAVLEGTIKMNYMN